MSGHVLPGTYKFLLSAIAPQSMQENTQTSDFNAARYIQPRGKVKLFRMHICHVITAWEDES